MVDNSSFPSNIVPLQQSVSKAEQALAKRMTINQEAASANFQEWADEGAFNPSLMTRRFESLELKARRTKKEEEAEKTEKKEIVEIEKLQKASQQYQDRNPELQARTLLFLKSRVLPDDSKEEILRKVLESYPDPSLADEALDFLLETSDAALSETIRAAKEDLNARFGREVRAGRNINQFAREFSQQGLGSPTALRDIYRDITGNPRDATTLFNELAEKFSYDKMRSVIDFILHSLGGDLKAKGPSIAHAELYRMLTELRSMQAILGVYRFFKSRMQLIQRAFARRGIALSSKLSFEMLSRYFVRLLMERYPSADKILQLAMLLGLQEELEGQVIVYTQMRDALRQVAPRLFRSDQHRQDVLKTFIDALEELEEKIEEKEDEEEEKEEEE